MTPKTVYRWYTFKCWKERDDVGLKLGPLSLSLWRDWAGMWHLFVGVLNRRLLEV